MKHYLSVFAMLARGSLFRVLLLLCLMTAGQCGLFLHRLNTALALYTAQTQQLVHDADIPPLEELMNFSTVSGIFGAAFLLICAVLCLPGCDYSTKCGYTLRRLNISERAVFVMQAIYNAFALFLLWVTEIGICLLLCKAYTDAVPAAFVSHQTTAIAFYRNSFLHSLLPLADTAVWIRNIVMLAALALTAASFPYKQRRGKFAADIVVCALLTVIFFVRTVGDGFNTAATVFWGLTAAAEVIHYVRFRMEGGADDDS